MRQGLMSDDQRVDLAAFDWDAVIQQTLDLYGQRERSAAPSPAKTISAISETR
jgi:hypothetical protein